MARAKNEQILSEQVQSRDPFNSPRMQSARDKASGSLEQNVDPFQPQQLEQTFSPLADQQNQVDNSLRQFVQQPETQEAIRVGQSRVPQQLERMGLGDLAKGLTFNRMGRLNLVLKLKERFGNDFFNNETARNAIAAFDNALAKDTQDQDEQMEAQLNTSERTLNELLRMQNGGRTR